MIKPEDASKKAAVWKGENWAQRLDMCCMFLHMHGFLTDSQNAQVDAKIEKWAAKGGIRREPLHTCETSSECVPCDSSSINGHESR